MASQIIQLLKVHSVKVKVHFVYCLMDAEPGRCRRTDGKKWRCRLAVLPDQKYCERHVNRGRLCSRKPVEVNKTVLESKSKPKSTTTTSFPSLKASPNLESSDKVSARSCQKVGIKNQSFKIKKHSSQENARLPLELTFSPRSVLQHGKGCVATSNNYNRAHGVAESGRCRRTDGKKWQCSKDALAGQKYCVQHMHRGAKKVDKSQKSNTGLSFSVGASYHQMGDNGNRSKYSSSSSDDDINDPDGATSSSEATTISM